MTKNKGKGKAKSSEQGSAGSSTNQPQSSTSHSIAVDTSSQPVASPSVIPDDTMANKMLRLNCIVAGQTNSFPVDIASSESVGKLKNKVKEAKANDLKEADADRLTLYLIEGGATKKELRSLRREELDDELSVLQTHFPKGADPTRIYIVVQPPPQGNATGIVFSLA